MTCPQQSIATDAVMAVQRAVSEIQDEALALGMAIQIMMELLRTVPADDRRMTGTALARIAANNLSAEEIQDPRPAAAG